jgi:lysophospholipase L1-like esterase
MRMHWILALVPLGASLACSPQAPARQLVPFPDPERWAEDLRILDEQDAIEPPPLGGIVFVGSSSIRDWATLEADMAPLTVVKRGFGGSTMEDVRYHLHSLVLRHEPRAIVLYEGDNDIGFHGVAPSQVLASFQALTRDLHAGLPHLRAYVLSVKPSPLRWADWPLMRETNALLRRACEQDPRLAYVDVAATLLDPNEHPRVELFAPDRLHLNPRGYAAWTEALRPRLIASESRYENLPPRTPEP